MIINLQLGHNPPRARVEYLLFGVKKDRNPDTVDILDGDPSLFVRLAEKNPYKTKTYNYLISFAETKEELQEKLKSQGKTIEDLYHEIISLLFPPEYYPREALNILAVGHADTDNYHIHLTVENFDHQNQKSLYIPKNKTEIKFYRALEKLINVRYNLKFQPRPIDKGRAGLEKIKQILEKRGKYRNKYRDKLKQELTDQLLLMIETGEIETREELIETLLEIPELEIKRIGKNYISIDYKGNRYRLKGGIYDEERFREIKRRLEGNPEPQTDLEQIFEETLRERQNWIKKRRKPAPGRTAPERLGSPDRELQQSLPQNLTGNLERIPEEKLNPPENTDSYNRLYSAYFPLDWYRSPENLLLPPLPANRKRIQSLPASRGNTLPRRKPVDTLFPDSYTYESRKLREKQAVRQKIWQIRQIELQYLRELSPEKILEALNIDYRKTAHYYLMPSPFTEDKNLTFVAFWNPEENRWFYKDLATGWTGSSIDLWKKIRHQTYPKAIKDMREHFLAFGVADNIEKALSILKHNLLKERTYQKTERENTSKAQAILSNTTLYTVKKNTSVSNPLLLKYLRSRKIEKLPDWLKEIHFSSTNSQKTLIAIGIENTTGAYNVILPENPLVEQTLCTSLEQSSSYSLIEKQKNDSSLIVVKDILDALALENINIFPQSDILILHTIQNLKRAVENGIFKRYDAIYLAFGNYSNSESPESFLLNHLRELPISVYKLHHKEKSLSEWLTSGSSPIEILNLHFPVYAGYREESGQRRLVLTDSIEVLKKLNLKSPTPIRTQEDITNFWVKQKCKGYVDIYFSPYHGIPEWVEEGLEKAGYQEEVYAPYLITRKETRTYKPAGIRELSYWISDSAVILQEEVEGAPQRYLNSPIREVRTLSSLKLREIESQKEEIEPQQEIDDDDYWRGLRM